MIKIDTAPGETRTQVFIEGKVDVLRARKAIYLGHLAINEEAGIKLAEGDIPRSKLISDKNLEGARIPLSFNNSALLIAGLRRVLTKNIIDDDHHLSPSTAFVELTKLGEDVELPDYMLKAKDLSKESLEVPNFTGNIAAGKLVAVE